MIRARIERNDFRFARPATTSRGTLLTKRVSFIVLTNDDSEQEAGIGECSLFPGLSADDRQGFDDKLAEVVRLLNDGILDPGARVPGWPSIRFGLETALSDLRAGGSKVLFPSAFTEGKETIPINGLVWMGSKEDMAEQIGRKLGEGFRCLKLKIGALDFEEEIGLIGYLRGRFGERELELRVDANGAFSPANALPRLGRLAGLRVHSIEQPIKAGQVEAMAALCASTPLPIALDEELIGIETIEEKRALIDAIRPQYLILKPGLLGGIGASAEWAGLADSRNVGWWVTSALETNIGLNAIAQWTFSTGNQMRQGLSTGKLFESNIPSPLVLRGERLAYDPASSWDLSRFHRVPSNE